MFNKKVECCEGLILWFQAEMLSKLKKCKVDPSMVDLDPELVLWFWVEILRKMKDIYQRIPQWNCQQSTLILVEFMISSGNDQEVRQK